MYVFMELEGKLSLNYPCYPFLSGPLIHIKAALQMRIDFQDNF